MGIYNCENTLEDAVDSIVKQTYKEWILIMCDDGSSDNTYAVAKQLQEKYADKIILIKNKENLGLNKTLNHCLEYADSEYIARMDGDDISLPTRLEQEIMFLERNPDYSIVSTPMFFFDENGIWGKNKMISYPQKVDFIKGTPFNHAPCMIRTEALKAVGGYSENKMTMRAEDYDLWFRLYEKGYRGHNLSDALYKMRDDVNAYHRRKFKYAVNEAYVRFSGYRRLKLSIGAYVYAIRPILVGLCPKPIYMKLHHKKLGNKNFENCEIH